MSYNWEKIFKNKSTKELYNIYKGNSYLSKDAAYYAKKELIKRNFDFDNIDAYKTSWKLSDLQEDEIVYQTEAAMRKFKFISFKRFIILLFSFIGLFFLFELNRDNSNYVLILKSIPYFYLTVIVLFIVLINNFIARLQYKSREKRLKEIEITMEKMEELKENKSVYSDYEKSKDILKKQEKKMRKMFKIFSLIGLIIMIWGILRQLGYLNF